jgi:hypothetical protein
MMGMERVMKEEQTHGEQPLKTGANPLDASTMAVPMRSNFPCMYASFLVGNDQGSQDLQSELRYDGYGESYEGKANSR